MTSSPAVAGRVASVAITSSASNPAISTMVMPSVSMTWRTSPICWRRMSGAASRGLVLGDALVAERGLGPVEGHHDAVGRWSRSRLTSIDVNPNTALVTCPDAVAMSVGSAKNAR
jgi:hypothetical protein